MFRRRLMALLAVVLFGTAGYLFFFREGEKTPQARSPAASGALEDSSTAPLEGGGTAPSPLAVRLDSGADPIHVDFKKPPKSALVFDLDTGKVLWRRDPTAILPIASLTKMMTALV